MKVTLLFRDGREETFEDVISIKEGHVQNQKVQTKKETIEFAPVPTEGKWFLVNPLTIDQNLFNEKREDSKQEETRQYILQAFEEMKKNSKYAKPFRTLVPPKTWDLKTVIELKKMASMLGDHMADWVEQALEWAQRIANGEGWEDMCNGEDKSNWYRLVADENKWVSLIGGSRMGGGCYSSTDVGMYSYCNNTKICLGVPLVVSYEV